MNASEAAQVLTAAALVDKRTVGEADARMWAEILPDRITSSLAIEAVKTYYRDHREMVMPADVIKYADQRREDISRRMGTTDMPPNLTPAEQRDWYREYMRVGVETNGDRRAAHAAADAAVGFRRDLKELPVKGATIPMHEW